MSIHFLCPLGHKLSVPDDQAGQESRCPVCKARLIVPERGLDLAAEDDAGGSAGNLPSSTPTRAAAEVAPVAPETVAPETEAPRPELRPAEPAAHQPESTRQSIQPPPVPWRSPVAPVASAPPLPDAPAPGPAASPPASRAPVRWVAWRRSDALDGDAIARPDPRQTEIAYWLASLLPFAAAFCAAPALPHMQFAGAPGWAQLMLSAAVLHMGFAAWLALLPDVSTIRVGVYLFAASAAAYLLATAAICLASNPQLSALGLSGIRWPAAAWCGLVCVVTSLTAGACGWIARHWRDAA